MTFLQRVLFYSERTETLCKNLSCLNIPPLRPSPAGGVLDAARPNLSENFTCTIAPAIPTALAEGATFSESWRIAKRSAPTRDIWRRLSMHLRNEDARSGALQKRLSLLRLLPELCRLKELNDLRTTYGPDCPGARKNCSPNGDAHHERRD